MYEIVIRSRVNREYTEWTEIIKAASHSAASRKAAQWLERNLFSDDYDEIEKWKLDKGCSFWDLH